MLNSRIESRIDTHFSVQLMDISNVGVSEKIYLDAFIYMNL